MVDYEKLSNEQHHENLANGQGDANTDDLTTWREGDDLASSMGVQSAGGAARKRVNESMLLLAIVLVVTAGVLFVMRKSGTASVDYSLSGAELKIEQALAQIGVVTGTSTDGASPLEAMFHKSDDVIAMFVNDPADKQVSPNQLLKNPFTMHLPTRNAVDDTPIAPVVTAEDRERQRRTQQLRAELSMLSLQTVMQGRTPIAVISGKVVREEEKLGSFTIVSIEPMSVVLAADGNTYRIAMKPPIDAGND